MHGISEKTLLSFVATMITVAVTTAIAAIVMKFSEIDYPFMDYLQQPFDPVDAGYIFLSELLIGCLGAIMDVVVTVIMTVNQMISHTPDLNSKTLIKSCRNVDVYKRQACDSSKIIPATIAGITPVSYTHLRSMLAFSTLCFFIASIK